MSDNGFLLLFDVSGYTRFLARSDLDQAPGILQSLLGTLIEHIAPPLVVAELEGDAVFAYAPDRAFRQGQTLVEVIEDLYCVFAAAREQMERLATCDCSGCRQFPDLDLKVIAHHGSFALKQMVRGHPSKPVGTDVVLAHRLLKNRIEEATGTKAYAFITQQCADALRLDWLVTKATPHSETYDHLGAVNGFVLDLAPNWIRERERRLVTVTPAEAWFELETELPASPALVWDHLSSPEFKSLWRHADRVDAGNHERTGEGTVHRCFQGEKVTVERIVDWRPFQHLTLDCEWPLGAVVRITTELVPFAGGTRLITRLGKPMGTNPVHTAAVRSAFRLRGRRVAKECRENLEKLRAWIEERTARSEPRPTSALT